MSQKAKSGYIEQTKELLAVNHMRINIGKTHGKSQGRLRNPEVSQKASIVADQQTSNNLQDSKISLALDSEALNRSQFCIPKASMMGTQNKVYPPSLLDFYDRTDQAKVDRRSADEERELRFLLSGSNLFPKTPMSTKPLYNKPIKDGISSLHKKNDGKLKFQEQSAVS